MKIFKKVLPFIFLFQAYISNAQRSNNTNELKKDLFTYSRNYTLTIRDFDSKKLESLKKSFENETFIRFSDFCSERNLILIEVSSQIPLRTEQIESSIKDKVLFATKNSLTDILIEVSTDKKNVFQQKCSLH